MLLQLCNYTVRSRYIRVTRGLEEEADGLDHDLEQLEGVKRAQEQAATLERKKAADAIASLEQRMQQQEEAYERESEEQQTEKRSVVWNDSVSRLTHHIAFTHGMAFLVFSPSPPLHRSSSNICTLLPVCCETYHYR